MKTFKKFLEQMDNTQGWSEVFRLASAIKKELSDYNDQAKTKTETEEVNLLNILLTEIIDYSQVLSQGFNNRSFDNIAHNEKNYHDDDAWFVDNVIAQLGSAIEMLNENPIIWLPQSLMNNLERLYDMIGELIYQQNRSTI